VTEAEDPHAAQQHWRLWLCLLLISFHRRLLL
jgi:hypothetical protein